MPRLASQTLFAADGLLVRRVTCDGHDDLRPADEGGDDARVVLVAQGRFTFQDARRRGVASPACGLFLPEGHAYRIRHIDGGDICLAVEGDLCRALVDGGAILRTVPIGAYMRVRDLTERLAAEEAFTRLAVEEILAAALGPLHGDDTAGRARDRSLAAAIAYELERRVDARLTLGSLADVAGVSIFHACRVFKRTTGLSIHQYHQDVRLRHALAWLLDTDRPLAGIAIDSGFANQGHFTNVFRRRFGTTPGRVRSVGGRGLGSFSIEPVPRIRPQ